MAFDIVSAPTETEHTQKVKVSSEKAVLPESLEMLTVT